MGYSLFLKKENFKFSSAHFTIFDAQTSEALHGHNYRVSVRLKALDSKLKNELVCDFNVVKGIVKSACDTLDEKVLIPKKSPFLKIQKSEHFKNHTHVAYNTKNYIFPNEDVLMLDMENITSEALAFYLAQIIGKDLKTYFSHITVGIEETRGQSAFYTRTLNRA